jgi:hypothetical protein
MLTVLVLTALIIFSPTEATGRPQEWGAVQELDAAAFEALMGPSTQKADIATLVEFYAVSTSMYFVRDIIFVI